ALALVGNNGVLLSQLHTAQLVQNLLADGGSVGIGDGGVVRHVELHAVDSPLSSAAAISNLALQQISVLEILISDLANGIIGLPGDSSLLIVHTTNLRFQLVKAIGSTEISFGNGLTATVTPAPS